MTTPSRVDLENCTARRGHLARLLLVAPVAAGLFFSQAQAQVVCAPRDAVLKKIVSEYGESVIGYGVSKRGDNTLTEIWVSETGSYTVTITRARRDGLKVTCILDAGEAWETVRPKPPEQNL